MAKKTQIGPDENGRYYYKAKSGNYLMNLKSVLNDDNYIEITESEYNELLPQRPVLSASELARQEKKRQIASLKSELAATDYQCLKFVEGWISEEDYASIKAVRQELRDQINELEASL